jgi:hypothetical protein
MIARSILSSRLVNGLVDLRFLAESERAVRERDDGELGGVTRRPARPKSSSEEQTYHHQVKQPANHFTVFPAR